MASKKNQENSKADWWYKQLGKSFFVHPLVGMDETAYFRVWCPDSKDQIILRAVCCELASFMSGGPFPLWLMDMGRTSSRVLMGTDGTEIEALGPAKPVRTPEELMDYLEGKIMDHVRPGVTACT